MIAALALAGFSLWILYRWRMHRQHFTLNHLGFELEKAKADIMIERERVNIEHARMHLDDEKSDFDGRRSKRIGARAGRGPFSTSPGGNVLQFPGVEARGLSQGPPPEVVAELRAALEKARQMDPDAAREYLTSRGIILPEGMDITKVDPDNVG